MLTDDKAKELADKVVHEIFSARRHRVTPMDVKQIVFDLARNKPQLQHQVCYVGDVWSIGDYDIVVGTSGLFYVSYRNRMIAEDGFPTFAAARDFLFKRMGN